MELLKLIDEKEKLEMNILELIQIFQKETDGFYKIYSIDFDKNELMDGSQIITDIRIKGLI